MFRTIFNRNTGEIISCQKLNDALLQSTLAGNSDWDYINAYTKGVKNIAVDPTTKKLIKTPPPPVTIDDIAEEVRSYRRKLLQNCDWTQSADSPLNDIKKTEWAAYRQALRDMPDNLQGVNNFDEVVWPTPPV